MYGFLNNKCTGLVWMYGSCIWDVRVLLFRMYGCSKGDVRMLFLFVSPCVCGMTVFPHLSTVR